MKNAAHVRNKARTFDREFKGKMKIFKIWANNFV